MDTKIENCNDGSPCNNTRVYTEEEILSYERRLVFGELSLNNDGGKCDDKQCDQIHDR